MDEDFVSLMDPNTGNTRDDLKLPTETDKDEEVAKRIRDGCEAGSDIFCTVLNSMGIEKIIDANEKN